jgi:hypothetical protein
MFGTLCTKFTPGEIWSRRSKLPGHDVRDRFVPNLRPVKFGCTVGTDENFPAHPHEVADQLKAMGPKAQKAPLTTKRKLEIAAGREREIAAGREREIAAGRSRDAVLHSIRVDLDSNAWPKKQLESVAAHKAWRKGGLLKVDGSQVSDDENEQVPKVQLRSCISFKGSPAVGGLLKPDGSELSPDVSDDEGLGSASSSCTTSVPRKKPAKQDRCAAKNDPALFKPPKDGTARKVHALCKPPARSIVSAKSPAEPVPPIEVFPGPFVIGLQTRWALPGRGLNF